MELGITWTVTQRQTTITVIHTCSQIRLEKLFWFCMPGNWNTLEIPAHTVLFRRNMQILYRRIFSKGRGLSTHHWVAFLTLFGHIMSQSLFSVHHHAVASLHQAHWYSNQGGQINLDLSLCTVEKWWWGSFCRDFCRWHMWKLIHSKILVM